MSEAVNDKTDGTVTPLSNKEEAAGDSGNGRSRRRSAPRQISKTTLDETRSGIDRCLEVVNAKLKRYGWWNGVLIGVNILFSTLATLTAGGVGMGGDRAAATLPGGWRVACFIAAGLSLVVALSSAYSGAYKVPETVARCKACQLEFSNLKLDFDDAKPATVVATFKRLRRSYNDILAGMV